MKTIQKKTIAGLVIIMLLASFVPNLLVYAATNQFTILNSDDDSNSSTLSPGDAFDVTVSVADGEANMDYLTVVITFDSTKLTLDDYSTYKDLCGSKQNNLKSPVDDDGTATFALVSPRSLSGSGNALGTNGKIAELNFIVNDGVTGSTDIVFNKVIYTDADGNDHDVTPSAKFTVNVPVAMTGLSLNHDTLTINKGQTSTLVATKEPQGTSDSTPITWSSTNNAVASVSNGIVSANSEGTAVITATCGQFSATCNVTVENRLSDFTATIDKNELDLTQSTKTAQITVNKVPADSSENLGTISYTSSNESVVTVNPSGLVTAVGIGNATITVSISGFSDKTLNVNVISPLNQIEVKGENGESSLTLTNSSKNALATVTSSGTADGSGSTTVSSVTWTSNDESIATVTKDSSDSLKGIIAPQNNGSTTITVTVITSDGTTLTDTISVDVTVPLEGMQINKNTTEIPTLSSDGTSFDLYVGQSQTLTYTFNPSNYSGSKAVNLSSSNENVAKIDNLGNIVAVAPGTAVITATTEATMADGNKSTDTISVRVPNVPIDTLTLNKTATTLEKGEDETLAANIASNDTSHQITDDDTITWTSSNPQIATVDNNGKVNAVAPGIVTITAEVESSSASATNGKLKAECLVTVKSTLTSITLNQTEMSLEAGETAPQAISYTQTPTDATVDSAGTPVKNSDGSNIVATYESQDTNVATVDNDGVVTAVGVGTTTITGSVGNISESVQVTVIQKLEGISFADSSTELAKGANTTLSVILNPTNANYSSDGSTKLSDLTTTWTSTDDTVASVDQNGKVTANAPGIAIITAELDGFNAQIIVNVPEVNASSIAISGVTDNADVERNENSEPQQLEVVMYDDNGNIITDSTDAVTWKVTDENGNDTDLASIDSNGKITYKKEGKIRVTATTTDMNGRETASASVTLNITEVHLESITATIGNNDIEEGKTTRVTYELNPSNTTDDITVEYETEDPSIATVDRNGVVKGLKKGSTTVSLKVIATDSAGNAVEATATLAVNVKAAPSVGPGGGSGTPNSGDVGGIVTLTTSPHTGDMNIEGLIAIMIISLVGMVTIAKTRRRK